MYSDDIFMGSHFMDLQHYFLDLQFYFFFLMQKYGI